MKKKKIKLTEHSCTNRKINEKNSLSLVSRVKKKNTNFDYL